MSIYFVWINFLNIMLFYQFLGFYVFWFLVISLIFKLFKGIWNCWLGYYLGFGVVWKPSSHSWAIVTGSTDGIGQRYAFELAKKGYSLLLLSRNEEKLKSTKQRILENFPKCSQVKLLAVDFSKVDIYDKIRQEVDQLDHIDVLVNNVGISFEHGEYFIKIPNGIKMINDMININARSAVKMIQIILPKMELGKRGVIINVSSDSANYPVPLLALYSSTKVFLDYFSRSLSQEYKKDGIIIQSVKPAFVSTKMSRLRKSITVPSADSYVKSALKTVGIENQTHGFWAHKVQGFIQNCVAKVVFWTEIRSILVFRFLRKLRTKYYKKFGIKE